MGTVTTQLLQDFGQRSTHHGATTAAAFAQPPGRGWGKTRVRACMRARARARSLACHVHGRARVPAGSPGAGACALRGLGVFLLNTCLHLPRRFGSREREPVRLMSARAGLCRYFTHAVPPCVCVCPCVCVHMRVRTCVRSVSQLAAAPAAGIPASQAVLEMNRLESIFFPLSHQISVGGEKEPGALSSLAAGSLSGRLLSGRCFLRPCSYSLSSLISPFERGKELAGRILCLCSSPAPAGHHVPQPRGLLQPSPGSGTGRRGDSSLP